jgi:hypothetical protein
VLRRQRRSRRFLRLRDTARACRHWNWISASLHAPTSKNSRRLSPRRSNATRSGDGPFRLAAKDLELVAEHDDLKFFEFLHAAAQQDQCENAPHGEVDERSEQSRPPLLMEGSARLYGVVSSVIPTTARKARSAAWGRIEFAYPTRSYRSSGAATIRRSPVPHGLRQADRGSATPLVRQVTVSGLRVGEPVFREHAHSPARIDMLGVQVIHQPVVNEHGNR